MHHSWMEDGNPLTVHRVHYYFAIGKLFVRQPRVDIRVTSEDRCRAVAQHAAEVAERRAVFDANNNIRGGKVVHWHPCTRRPDLGVGTPGSVQSRAWG